MAITKREKTWKNKLPPGKQYSIDDALKLVKEFDGLPWQHMMWFARDDGKAGEREGEGESGRGGNAQPESDTNPKR